MPIPSKPLAIKDYDPDELTLDEDEVLFGETIEWLAFRKWLREHVAETSWTKKEIGQIKNNEILAVRQLVWEAIADMSKARPLPETPPDSKSGPEATVT